MCKDSNFDVPYSCPIYDIVIKNSIIKKKKKKQRYPGSLAQVAQYNKKEAAFL